MNRKAKVATPTAILIILMLSLCLAVPLPFGASPVKAQEWTNTADELTVTWQLLYEGIGHKEYLISVQNLRSETRVVELETLFSHMDFPTSSLSEVSFYEWTEISEVVSVPDYNIIHHVESNGTEWDEYQLIGYHDEIRSHLGWEPCKMQYFERTAKVYRDNMGSITLPPFGSESEEGTENGTKLFRLVFDTPIHQVAGGWGSGGKVALWLDGTEFHPWFNSSWSRRCPVLMNNSANANDLTDYQLLVNVTYDSDMQSDFDDLRFTHGASEQEIPYWIEKKVDGSYAECWVKVLLMTEKEARIGLLLKKQVMLFY